MEEIKIGSTVFSCLLNQDRRLNEKYYSSETIVVLLFRLLDVCSQTIIFKLLSTSQENFNYKDKVKQTHVEKLKNLKIIEMAEEDKHTINKVFRATLSRVLSKGPKNIFKPIESYIDNDSNEDNWMRVYAYILKDISKTSPKKLSKEITDIINKEGLVINSGEFREEVGYKSSKSKSFGFTFMVQPINCQVNRFMKFFVDYFFKKNYQQSQKLFNEVYLVELIGGLSLLPVDEWHMLAEDFPLPFTIIESIFISLDSIGLLTYNPSKRYFKISSLLSEFLDPNKTNPEKYKTNIIVENDFRLYAYSSMDYLKFFLSILIRFVY